MHIVQHAPRRMRRRMYSPLDRPVVNGVGLGEVDGLFNIGKMFTRMFTITPSSFKFSNIAGAIGSLATTTATFGLANVASELTKGSGKSFTSAHSAIMKDVGYGTMAAAAVVGGVLAAPAIGGALGIGGTAATGTALTAGTIGTATEAAAAGTALGVAPVSAAAAGGGFLSTVGSVLSTVGSGALNVLQAIPFIGGLLGGGGGGGVVVQTGGGDPYATQQAQQAAQAAYDAQVAAQQAAMYNPMGYNPNIPYTTPSYSGPISADAGTGYGDLRSPYTLTSEDGTQQVAVDPMTGQPIQAGMLPDWSATTWLMVGGVTLLGWYLMPSSKSIN